MSTDWRAELQALLSAYDAHGGRWPQHHEDALMAAVEHARAVLARFGHQPAPVPVVEFDCPACEDVPIDTIRAALKRLQEPENKADLSPAPAPAGKAAEVMGLFRRWADAYPDGVMVDPYWLTRAADLLEQRQAAPVPVPVSERLPEPSVKVLAHYFNDLGKGRTICAIWVPAKTRSDSYGDDDDDFTEYDEESDTFYWPEGWYEAIDNWVDLGYVKVNEGEVIYWQPLPKWPVHALPLPAGEVE